MSPPASFPHRDFPGSIGRTLPRWPSGPIARSLGAAGFACVILRLASRRRIHLRERVSKDGGSPTSQRSLRAVVVDLHGAVVAVAREGRPAHQRITNSRGYVRLFRKICRRPFQGRSRVRAAYMHPASSVLDDALLVNALEPAPRWKLTKTKSARQPLSRPLAACSTCLTSAP
jgi:hypothetical protein